jgi:hypothetical protein
MRSDLPGQPRPGKIAFNTDTLLTCCELKKIQVSAETITRQVAGDFSMMRVIPKEGVL